MIIFDVFGEEWTLDFVPDNSPLLKDDKKIFHLGICDTTLKSVFISNQISGAKLVEVIAHELAHCIYFYTGSGDNLTEEDLAGFVGKYSCTIQKMAEKIAATRTG